MPLYFKDVDDITFIKKIFQESPKSLSITLAPYRGDLKLGKEINHNELTKLIILEWKEIECEKEKERSRSNEIQTNFMNYIQRPKRPPRCKCGDFHWYN